MGESITILPVIIEAFHPIHELKTLTLVIVSCTKLHGKGTLVVAKFYPVCFVKSLIEQNFALIGMSHKNLFFSDE